MKLSVVIPAHNEAGSIGRRVEEHRRRPSRGEGIDYEIDRRRRRQHRRDERAWSSAIAADEPAVRCLPLPLQPRLRLRRAGRARRASAATRSRS